MAGFRVLKDIGEAELQKLPISSQTLSPGDLITRAVGSTTWAAATATSLHFNPKAIVMETVTSAATSVLAYRLTGLETVAAEVTTPSSSDNGDRMVLVDKNTVSNTGTDSATEYVCFVQEGILSTEIVGRVLVGNGVDPDATTT